MTDLFDIAAVERYPENRIASYAQSEPLRRFESSDLAAVEAARRFGSALTTMTQTIVVNLVLESKRPYIASVAKSLEPGKLRRLSTLIA